MKFLCRIGWHKWKVIDFKRYYSDRYPEFYVFTIHRECENCKKKSDIDRLMNKYEGLDK